MDAVVQEVAVRVAGPFPGWQLLKVGQRGRQPLNEHFEISPTFS